MSKVVNADYFFNDQHGELFLVGIHAYAGAYG